MTALTALDATFLELVDQSESAVMNVGAVLVFEPRPDPGPPALVQLTALIETRLAGLPLLRQRLSAAHAGGWSWPRWVEDPRSETAGHVRRAALPPPGGDPELCDWIADFASHRLDRTRPLWEMVLLEGLKDGRWGIAMKLHHCLMDGASAAAVAELLLDAQPSSETGDEQALGAGPPQRSGWGSLVPDPPPALAQAVRAGASFASAGIHAALAPREVLARSRALAELIVADELIGAPHCSLSDPTGSTRRYAAVRCRLGELKAIARGLGGQPDDAVLAACTSGLRSLLLERGEEPPAQGLRAMFPVNLRRAPEALALGTRTGSLFVSLPVAEPSAIARHRGIAESTRRLRRSHAGPVMTALTGAAELAPPLIHASIARVLYGTRLFNLAIATVEGALTARYAFGSELREVHPIVPLAAEHAVGIAIVSHHDRVTFGVSADCESVPDLGVLAYGIAEGIDDLVTAATHSGSAASASAGDTHITHH